MKLSNSETRGTAKELEAGSVQAKGSTLEQAKTRAFPFSIASTLLQHCSKQHSNKSWVEREMLW